jgi:hypothetical protein
MTKEAIMLGKTFAEKQREQKGSDYDRDVSKLKQRINELEQVCAELYQVIGSLSDHAGLFDHQDVIRALDQASQARIVHDDLLPWPREALNKSKESEDLE